MTPKTLLDIRTMFVKFSGRYDLSSADFATDSGADFFIQCGQDWLEREVGNERNSPFYFDNSITTGISTVSLLWTVESSPLFQSIDKVYISGGPQDIGVTNLEYADIDTLFDKFPDWDETENSEPAYWGWELGAHLDEDSVSFSTLRIMPPSDGDYTLRIYGHGLDKPLLSNTDYNSWTIYHPNVLLASAFFQLYSLTGEIEKRDGAFKVLQSFASTIDKIQVERELNSAKEKII